MCPLLLQCLLEDFLAVAVKFLLQRDKDPVEAGSGVPLAAAQLGVGGRGGEKQPGEEDVGLDVGALEPAVVVVDSGQRQRVIQRVVVENTAHQREQPVTEFLLHLPAAFVVLLQVAHPHLGVTDHGGIGLEDLLPFPVEVGVVEPQRGKQGFLLHLHRCVDEFLQLLANAPQRHDKGPFGPPLRRLAIDVHRRMVDRLHVGEDVAGEPHLDAPGLDPGIVFAIDPDRALPECLAGRVAGGLEFNHPAIPALDRAGSAKAVAVFLHQRDFQRHLRRPLRLDDRDFREPPPPFHSAKVDPLPGPVEALPLGVEEVALPGHLEGAAGGHGEAEILCLHRAVSVQPAGLAVLEDLQPAQDLGHRHLVFASDGDLLVQAAQGRTAQAVHPDQQHRPGIFDGQLVAVPHVAESLDVFGFTGEQVHQLRLIQPALGQEDLRRAFTRGGLDHQPQTQVLGADKGPGAFPTLRFGVRIVGEFTAELPGQHLVRPQVGLAGTRIKEGQRCTGCSLLGGPGQVQFRLRRCRKLVHDHRQTGVQAHQFDNACFQRFRGCRFQGHTLDIGDDLPAVQLAQRFRAGRLGCGDDSRSGVGAGNGHRNLLEQKGVFLGGD